MDSLLSSQNKILCPQIRSEGTCSNCLAVSFNTHFCLERLFLVFNALNQMLSHVVYLYNFTMFVLPLYPEINYLGIAFLAFICLSSVVLKNA